MPGIKKSSILQYSAIHVLTLTHNNLTVCTGLEPNSVTNIDESEDSDDSLPLVVPNTPPLAKKKQPATAQTFGGPQLRSQGNIGEDREMGHLAVTRLLPQQYSDDRESSLGVARNEAFLAYQRTRHGSPHPAKRGAMKSMFILCRTPSVSSVCRFVYILLCIISLFVAAFLLQSWILLVLMIVVRHTHTTPCIIL